MNLANLDRLIATLEALERSGRAGRFRMEAYYVVSGGDEDDDEPIRLARVPEALRSPDPRDCGTAACLAGWCQILGAETAEDREEFAGEFARRWLGLDDEEGSYLFLGEWAADDEGSVELATITLPRALAHLRAMRGLEAPP